MDIEDTRKACKRLGVGFAEANHRIYNEPPSMSFIKFKIDRSDDCHESTGRAKLPPHLYRGWK